MTFPQAIKSVFSRYAKFSGRAGKAEFWWFYLFSFVLNGVLQAIGRGIDSTKAPGSFLVLIGAIIALAMLLPTLAVGVRRLHDTGRSGWWMLLSLIPLIGTIWLIIYWVGDTKPPNQWGEGPLPAVSA